MKHISSNLLYRRAPCQSKFFSALDYISSFCLWPFWIQGFFPLLEVVGCCCHFFIGRFGRKEGKKFLTLVQLVLQPMMLLSPFYGILKLILSFLDQLYLCKKL